ncbi:hypothetical protein WICMUC_001571 [Wickerhamomyces mucosus]|uniref:UDP-glucose 4-epimerase n=1 Tax=Wickerhamomyces mucosus TaxID=1378264 RepID=A0A9P8PU08_9ASCO|nr:hypothetical protein WICMUC_001571 [Wickerhamomyces mucosus]
MVVPESTQYVLVTGGLGYIGSHTVIKLIENGYKVLVVDNLENSKIESLHRIKRVLKTSKFEIDENDLLFYQEDLRNFAKIDDYLNKFYQKNNFIETIIHFAGLKSVNESVLNPLKYYDCNIISSLNLLKILDKFKIKNLIFSSSATVYGDVTSLNDDSLLPLKEDLYLKTPVNPYGNTKLIIETMLKDYAVSNKDCKIATLRYFNPIGAHPSGLIGEDPLGEPMNLLPILSKFTMEGKRLKVFGNDYNTQDGTCIRDYIHVQDLSRGHVLTLEKLNDFDNNYNEWNLGSGEGVSVLQIVKAWGKTTGIASNFEIVNKRSGDVEILLADVTKSKNELNFECEYGIAESCEHLWNWTLNYFKELELNLDYS